VTPIHIDLAHIVSSSTKKAYTTDSLKIDLVLVVSSSKAHYNFVLWHERMGHMSIDTINKMSANDNLSDFKLEKHTQLQHSCTSCMLGKKHKSTYKYDPDKQLSLLPGQLIHGDVSGKQSQNPSVKGSMYYVLYKDDATV